MELEKEGHKSNTQTSATTPRCLPTFNTAPFPHSHNYYHHTFRSSSMYSSWVAYL